MSNRQLCPHCMGTDVQHAIWEPCYWEEQQRQFAEEDQATCRLCGRPVRVSFMGQIEPCACRTSPINQESHNGNGS